MKKRVLIVSWEGEKESGGVEFVTYYMHKIWGDMCDVQIIDYRFVEKLSFVGRLLKKHYVLDAVLISLCVNRYLRKLRKKLGTENVVIITQGYNAPFVKADIAFAHGTMRGFEQKALCINKWDFYEVFEVISWKKAIKVVAVSEYVKEEAIKLYGIKPNKIEVIENSVDTSIFYPMFRNENEVKTILFCGRISPEKNPSKLLELADIIEKDDRFRFRIATPSKEGLEKFQKYNKTEILIGVKREEMNGFYNSGNVMFFPSLYEGFGLVTAECLSSGVPVIGYDVGAVGDFYHRGFKGVELLSDRMKDNLDLMYNLCKEYGDFTRRLELHKQIENNHSFEVYKHKLLNLMLGVND